MRPRTATLVWVESTSPSFRARHHIEDADSADRVLYGLEETRAQLEYVFPRIPQGLTVVLHGGAFALAFANPLLPVIWTLATPASRRYIAGWAGSHELHVLSPEALDARAANIEGSKAMLAKTPSALYAKRVITENSRLLSKATAPKRASLELRWAWLLDGGARWFANQTEHARPAIARRLRERPSPCFPPSLRDAALLGQTVIDLLARTEGEDAAAHLITRLGAASARPLLAEAFGVRSLRKLEQAWRAHLLRLADPERHPRLRLGQSVA